MAADLASLLAGYAPFDALDPQTLSTVASAASIDGFSAGEQILDAFVEPTAEVFLVIAGRVHLWNDTDRLREAPDEILGPGELFGFSAMLTESRVGPRAVAATDVTAARMPGSVVAPAFATRPKARFLAEQVSTARHRSPGTPAYSLVDELIVGDPVVVDTGTPAGDVARLMTERGLPYAAVSAQDGSYGLITDSVLRKRLLVEGLPPDTPAGQVMQPEVATALLGDSAAEAWITLLDADAEFLLVTDRTGRLRGVVAPRDFAVSPTTAGVALHEQLRRAGTIDELDRRARRVPGMLGDLLFGGLASGKVIAVYSAILDTIVRRSIALIFEQHPELAADAFTWLSLGSNGRREAVLSSDVDSAAAFDNATSANDIAGYRAAFGEVAQVLSRAGLTTDDHGATAQHRLFARTNASWRAAAEQWLAAPTDNKGAVMTSLLVDGRPIHGDPGLPEVARVFSDLRRHPGTMRLLLQESLARRASTRSMRGLLSRRAGTFDVKEHAVRPIVNLARWAALSVGSAALSTVDRLQAAAGSAMLPQGQADTLVEVFEVLQRLRLRYQIQQYRDGARPTDLLEMEHVSPLDRSVVAQAVREVASVQRRMDNVSHYIPAEAWASPDPA